jgi:hypothetical protein
MCVGARNRRSSAFQNNRTNLFVIVPEEIGMICRSRFMALPQGKPLSFNAPIK